MKSPERPIRVDTSQMATRDVGVPLPVPGRRAQEAPPIDRPEPRKKGIGKGVRNALITATALTALGGAGYAAYQEIPAIHRAISGLGSGEVPSAFDITASEGVIGPNNTIKLPQAEIDQQFPTAFAKLNDGKNTLQLQYGLDTSASSNPNKPLEYSKSFNGLGGIEPARRAEYERQGYYDTVDFKNVPTGTLVKSPVDGYLVFSRDETQIPTDPTLGKYTSAFIYFLAPNGNHYKFAITGGTTLRDGQGTAFLLNPSSPDISVYQPKIHSKQPIGSFGIAIKKGELIAQVASPAGANQIEDLNFMITGARQGETDKVVDISQPYIPTNLELLMTPDGKVISS